MNTKTGKGNKVFLQLYHWKGGVCEVRVSSILENLPRSQPESKVEVSIV